MEVKRCTKCNGTGVVKYGPDQDEHDPCSCERGRAHHYLYQPIRVGGYVFKTSRRSIIRERV